MRTFNFSFRYNLKLTETWQELRQSQEPRFIFAGLTRGWHPAFPLLSPLPTLSTRARARTQTHTHAHARTRTYAQGPRSTRWESSGAAIASGAAPGIRTMSRGPSRCGCGRGKDATRDNYAGLCPMAATWARGPRRMQWDTETGGRRHCHAGPGASEGTWTRCPGV